MNETNTPQASPAKKRVAYENIAFIPFLLSALVWLVTEIIEVIEMVRYAKAEYAYYEFMNWMTEKEAIRQYLQDHLPTKAMYYVPCILFFLILALVALRRRRSAAYPVLYGMMTLGGIITLISEVNEWKKYGQTYDPQWVPAARLVIQLPLVVGYLCTMVFAILLLKAAAESPVRRLHVIAPILIAACWLALFTVRAVNTAGNENITFFNVYWLLFGDLPKLLTAAGVFCIGKWLAQPEDSPR